MGITTMKIASIVPPSAGKNRGRVIGEDGTQFGIFADKLHLVQPGRAYEIKFSDGQYQNVMTAVPVAEPPAAPVPLRPVRQQAPQRDPAASYAAPTGTASKDEQIFVMCGLKEFIRAGQIGLERDEIIRAMIILRSAFTSGFGETGNTFRASEAGRQARG